jgi:hypoxanthine phosphoribosyltransferase
MSSKKIVHLKDKSFDTFIDAETIQKRIKELGLQISEDYQGKFPLCLGVLNGCFVFAADLMRELSIDVDVSFAKYSSYQNMESSGNVKKLIGLKDDELKGRDIIIIEDIVDTGLTMESLLNKLKTMSVNSVEVATLLLKPDALQIELDIKYVGFEIENKFVVGYGLDYDGLGRNLKDIYQLCS